MNYEMVATAVLAIGWLIFILMALALRLTRWAWAEHARFFKELP